MFKLFRKKKEASSPSLPSDAPAELTWDEQATQGLQQALAQAPVPALLKEKVHNELKKAAEDTARAAGRATVTAQDLMEGLLSKLPAGMRDKVTSAMAGGPDKLKDLEQELKR